MARSRSVTSSFFLGTLFAISIATSPATPEEYVYGGAVQRVADRCARLGEGLVDLGNGVCGRTSEHIRVGTSNAAMAGWASSGTSNAAMRSTGPTMVPGAEITRRLRVRGDLDSVSPFR